MDKLYHLAAGFLVSLAIGLIAYFGFQLSQPEAYGWGASLIAGAGKEFYDLYKAWRSGAVINWKTLPKIWDFFDFGATCVGGFAGIFILIVGFKL